MKISGSQNPQVGIQWMWTLFEHLWANKVIIHDFLKGMISIGALLSKWQHVGEVYLQGHPNPASIRFADTCDLVIAEYELDNCSLALAAQFSSATK